MTASGSGFRFTKGRSGGLIGAKRKRMPIIVANGVLCLTPSALFLAFNAQTDDFDPVVYAGDSVTVLRPPPRRANSRRTLSSDHCA
jgi:hypothetical protein